VPHKLIIMAMHTVAAAKERIRKRPCCRQEVFLPMHGAYTICTEMFGSGAAIGMAIILHRHKPTLKEHYPGRPVCFVVVVGTVLRSGAGRRSATNALRTPTTTIWASDLCLPSKKVVNPFLPFKFTPLNTE
jgi:hypothetical protein